MTTRNKPPKGQQGARKSSKRDDRNQTHFEALRLLKSEDIEQAAEVLQPLLATMVDAPTLSNEVWLAVSDRKPSRVVEGSTAFKIRGILNHGGGNKWDWNFFSFTSTHPEGYDHINIYMSPDRTVLWEVPQLDRFRQPSRRRTGHESNRHGSGPRRKARAPRRDNRVDRGPCSDSKCTARVRTSKPPTGDKPLLCGKHFVEARKLRDAIGWAEPGTIGAAMLSKRF